MSTKDVLLHPNIFCTSFYFKYKKINNYSKLKNKESIS